MWKTVILVCILSSVLMGCGARDTLADINEYKEESASVESTEYIYYAYEIYGSTIPLEYAIEKLGASDIDVDSEYYKAFVNMVEALNYMSKDDVIRYYGKWRRLNGTEKLAASYMVFYGILDRSIYDKNALKTIDQSIEQYKVICNWRGEK